MDPHHAQAQPSSLRFVLRLLVLAGAAVVWWLLISGGPAQADDARPRGQVSTATVSQTVTSARVSQGTSGTLHRTVAVVTGPLRQGPTRTADLVDRSTAPAPAPLREAVRTIVGALEPTLTITTTHLADVVDRTATTVDGAVQPVLQATGLATGLQAQPTHATPAATLVAAAAHKIGRAHLAQALSVSRQVATATPLVSAAAVGADAVDRVVQGLGGTELPGLPSGHDLPGAPSSGTVALAGMLAGLALLLPTLLRRRLSFDAAALLAGPAYPPGSSPG